MTVRTRFAPSPTGRLHLGNVRAAAFNWLFSRRHGGAFLLRIEDTDTERNVEGGEQGILDDLRWLGLDWDEGPDIGGPHAPYRQSERDSQYAEAIESLRASGDVYPCFCPPDDPEATGTRRYAGTCRRLSDEDRAGRLADGVPHVLRFAVPEAPEHVEVNDEIFGDISFPINDIDDFVVRRSDGRVTYNFGVVVDDRDMAITHVIRGVGHLSNTPKQVLLFDALGAPRPVFAHLPQVMGKDGRKLSKREGAMAVSELRAAGYPPHAVVNYLSLLGWSHPDEREVMGLDELIAAIGVDRVGRSDTQFDPEKFHWVCAQHLAAESLETLVEHVAPFIDRGRFPDLPKDLCPVVDTLRTRLSTYGEINEHLGILYPEDIEAARARRRSAGVGESLPVLVAVREALSGAEEWSAEPLGALVRAAGNAVGVRGAGLFHPVRMALIASEQGPDLGKILTAVGRLEALRRMDEAMEG